jgi:hypothetical protein
MVGESGDVDQVECPIAQDLVSKVDTAAAGVAGLGNYVGHVPTATRLGHRFGDGNRSTTARWIENRSLAGIW